MAKYNVAVHIQTSASKCIGHVECDSLEEFNKKAEELWESQEHDCPSTNTTNDFDLGDWDFLDVSESDLKYYKTK